MRHISRSRLGFTRCGFLVPRGSRMRREALEDVGLLIAVEAAGDAAPEDPPIDFVLHLIGERQAGGVDAARLLDAEIVAGKAEAGAQTEAAQIEPAELRAPGCVLRPSARSRNAVGQLADGGERPGVACRAPASVRAWRAVPRARRAISPAARRRRASVPAPPSCASSLITAAALRSTGARPAPVLRSSNCRRQRLLADLGFGPDFERADLGQAARPASRGSAAPRPSCRSGSRR